MSSLKADTPFLCPAGIPADLRPLPQWVLWQYEARKDKDQKDVWTKVPINPHTRGNANSTDPATWGTFEQVYTLYKDEKLGDGIGFVLTPPFVGIDLDNCINKETGEVQDWALKIVKDLDGYAELSPSETGVKIIVKGEPLPPKDKGGRRRKGNVEMYSEGRFFTITGNIFADSPTEILERPEQVKKLYRETFKSKQKPATKSSPRTLTGPTPDDQRIIEKVIAKPKYACLWRGDVVGFDSPSEADLSLVGRIAFFVGPDHARIASIFARSGLVREKWSQRADYRNQTIAKALTTMTNFYEWRVNRKASSSERRSSPRTANAGGGDTDEVYLTQQGNAQALVREHGNQIRFNASTKRWMVWAGTRWGDDRTGEVCRMAKGVARRLFGLAADPELEPKAVYRHATDSEKATGISAMLKLAESEAGITVVAEQLDADPMLLNVLTGTIDLRTGKLQPHDPANLISKLAPVHYDPNARCPLWEKFLDRAMAGVGELKDYLQRIAGLVATGDASVQELFVFYGAGANGKSVFLDTIGGILGDYASEAPPSLVTARAHDEHPTEIADLAGRRLVVASETEEGARLRIQLIKRLTGNARLKGRFMRQDFFEFPRTHKLVLVTNNKPSIAETTNAVWRRVRLFPFNVTIPEEERDPRLLEKLRAEWPGILVWMVRGCLQWQKNGIQTPDAVKAATDEYRVEQDPLSEWIASRCILGAGCHMTRAESYSDYQEWARESGERYPLDRNVFYEHVRRVEGVEDGWAKFGGKPTRVWNGIGLSDLGEQFTRAQMAIVGDTGHNRSHCDTHIGPTRAHA